MVCLIASRERAKLDCLEVDGRIVCKVKFCVGGGVTYRYCCIGSSFHTKPPVNQLPEKCCGS